MTVRDTFNSFIEEVSDSMLTSPDTRGKVKDMNTIRRNTLNSLITPIAMEERTARLARDTNKAKTFAWGINVFKIAFNQNDTEVGAVSEVVAILARNAHIKSWDADAIESMQFTADYALILARAVENAANQKVAA